jgi:hypothetical protein
VKSLGVGSILFVLMLTAIAAVGALAGGMSAASLSGSAPSTVDNVTPTPGATFGPSDVPPDTLAQLANQAPGTIIVPCSSTQPVLPDGANYSINPFWFARHPGFRYLKHGYCADNPSATPLPSGPTVVQAP